MAASVLWATAFFLADADVLNQKMKRRLLCNLQGSLNLVHRGDAIALLDGCDVDRRRAAATPLLVVVHGRVHGVERNAGAAEPVGDLAHVLAVGVVEVAAGGEDLDCLSATGDELVQ